MCMIDDGEMAEFMAERDIKAARKEHRCDECRRTIRVGEPYRSMRGKYDGRFYVVNHCAHCNVAAEWLMVACKGYLFNAVLEDLREHWEFSESMRSDQLRVLIDGMAAGWHGGTDPIPDAAAVRACVPAA